MGSKRPRFNGGGIVASVAFRAQVMVAVDRAPEVPVQSPVERSGLDQEHGGEIVGRIDPEQGRPGAVPEELADRSAIFLRGLRLSGPDEDIEAEPAAALAGKPQSLRDAG